MKIFFFRWFTHVSNCLELAQSIAKIIHEQKASVIVSDPDGRNFGILVTSLVQVLLDPFYRSLLGLQALIQKDWVMKGFPFCKRLGHIRTVSKQQHSSQIQVRTASFKGKEERREKDLSYDGESPIYVLFLECLHQLLRQFPLEFEYTEQFLILLFDVSHSSLFSTFLLDSNFEHREHDKFSLMTAWDFIATNIPQSKYISVFTNASYKLDQINVELSITDNSVSSMNKRCSNNKPVITKIHSSVPRLFLWSALLFRWFPCTDFHKGSSREVALQLQQIQYMDELLYLKDRVIQLRQQSTSQQQLSPEPETASTSVANSNNSSKRHTKRHKRNASRFSNNEEVQNDFLNIMTGFYFLKML